MIQYLISVLPKLGVGHQMNLRGCEVINCEG